MKRLSTIAFLAVALPMVAFSQLTDEEAVSQLTKKWTAAWNIGDGEFQPETFRELFAAGEKQIEVYDNVKGDVLVIQSVDDYVETWRPFMEPLEHWSVELHDLAIRVSGDLAFTTFRLDGTDTRGQDGTPITFGQYGTHVWERFPDIGWRIVHEHLTAYDRKVAENKHAREIAGIDSIDHISISTNNPELPEWYKTVLDFETEADWEAPAVVPGLSLMYLVHPSGTRLEVAVGNKVREQDLFPQSVPEDFSKAGFRHLCFNVDSVDRVIEIAKERGAKVLAEPFDFPLLKKRLAFIQDPDGNSIEFVQPMR